MKRLDQCRLCGSDRLRLLTEAPGVAVFRCDACGCGLASYVEADHPDQPFDESYAADLDEDKAQHCWDVFARVVPPPWDGLSLLDVGCGRGEFLDRAALAGMHTSGLEPSASAGLVSDRHRVIRMEIEVDSVPRQAFDVVTLWDVLEHTHDPGAALSTVIGAMKPGGWLIVVTPAMGTVFDRAGVALSRLTSGRERRLLDMCWSHEHLTRFAGRGLAAEVQRRGCVQVEVAPVLLLSLRTDRYAGGAVLPRWTASGRVNEWVSRFGVKAARALHVHNKVLLSARRPDRGRPVS